MASLREFSRPPAADCQEGHLSASLPTSSSASARPTLADVAALAGVSTATASRVLNGGTGVSAASRAEVRAAVTRLSYVPLRTRHAPAGSSATACWPADACGLIAAVVCEDGARMFADSFFSRLLQGVTDALPARQIQLAMLAIRGPADRAAAERFLARSRPDGVLMISSHDGNPMTAYLEALAVPTVLAGRPLSGSALSYVDADNRIGARRAVASLIDSGRRAIATITGPQDMAAGLDRLAGYREAVCAAGMPQICAAGDFTVPSGEAAMARLLRIRPDLDAVFAAADLMAAGALRALRRAGRRVPEDVAVVGFDDAPFTAHTSPPLTTVHQPVEEMGAVMVRQLLRQLSEGGAPLDPAILATTPVPRESA